MEVIRIRQDINELIAYLNQFTKGANMESPSYPEEYESWVADGMGKPVLTESEETDDETQSS